MADSLAEALGQLLLKKEQMLAVAETTTGGLISSRIVSVPGSSAFYERGVIAYSKASKIDLLRIDPAVLDTFGAVSAEAAAAMAEGVRRVSGTQIGLAETGIAGPIRGRSPKPVGTAFVALSCADGMLHRAFQFDGDRDAIRCQIADAAIQMVLDICSSG